jgi:hypothetical protein
MKLNGPRSILLAVVCLGACSGLTACTATSSKEPVNQRRAQTLAQRMLASVVMPASSQRLETPPPAALDEAGQKLAASSAVDLHSLWKVSMSAARFNKFAISHRPAATTLAGTSTGGSGDPGPNGLDWAYRHPPGGIGTASLVYSFAPLGSRSTAVRIDTDVIWLPPRTAATQVPTSDRSATISLQSLAPAVGNRSLTLAQGDPLSALIHLVNNLKTAPSGEAMGCAMSTTSISLTFSARAGGPASATASQTIGCVDLGLRVGRHEILLEQAPLVTMELSLLHLSNADLYGPGS